MNILHTAKIAFCLPLEHLLEGCVSSELNRIRLYFETWYSKMLSNCMQTKTAAHRYTSEHLAVLSIYWQNSLIKRYLRNRSWLVHPCNDFINYHCHIISWWRWKSPQSWAVISRQAFVFSVIEQENMMSSLVKGHVGSTGITACYFGSNNSQGCTKWVMLLVYTKDWQLLTPLILVCSFYSIEISICYLRYWWALKSTPLIHRNMI